MSFRGVADAWKTAKVVPRYLDKASALEIHEKRFERLAEPACYGAPAVLRGEVIPLRR